MNLLCIIEEEKNRYLHFVNVSSSVLACTWLPGSSMGDLEKEIEVRLCFKREMSGWILYLVIWKF